MSWNKIKQAISKAEKIYIFSHINPDGDSIGSTLALALSLINNSKNKSVRSGKLACPTFIQKREIIVFSSAPVPPQYSFLPGTQDIIIANSHFPFPTSHLLNNQSPITNHQLPITNNKSNEPSDTTSKAILQGDSRSHEQSDTSTTPITIHHSPITNNHSPTDFIAVVIDSGSIDRVGDKLVDFVKSAKLIINIDHHISNTNFGHLNFIDSSASSSSEIIYKLLKDLQLPLDKEIATNLYVGIMTDTGSFKYTNTNISAFEISADLMNYGIIPSEINNLIYNCRSVKWLKLLGNALSNLSTYNNNRVGWITITKDMWAGMNVDELEGIIDVLNWGKDFEVFMQFLELEPEKTKISFRSKGRFNVDILARGFGGGGHPTASGAKVSSPLKSVIKDVIIKIEELTR